MHRSHPDDLPPHGTLPRARSCGGRDPRGGDGAFGARLDGRAHRSEEPARIRSSVADDPASALHDPVAGRRPAQGDQRLRGPRGRRRAAPRGRAYPRAARARMGRHGPGRRRRVRRVAPRGRSLRSEPRGRAHARRHALPAARERTGAYHGRLERGPRRRRSGLGLAACRPVLVQGQARRRRPGGRLLIRGWRGRRHRRALVHGRGHPHPRRRSADDHVPADRRPLRTVR